MQVERNLIEATLDRDSVKPGQTFHVAISPPDVSGNKRRRKLSCALALCLDQSGSMAAPAFHGGPTKWSVQLDTLAKGLGMLVPDTPVEILTFDTEVRSIFKGSAGTALRSPNSPGGLSRHNSDWGATNLSAAIDIAGSALREHTAASRRCILFTDGLPTVGEHRPDRLAEQARRFSADGIHFDSFGFGEDADSATLSRIVGVTGQSEHISALPGDVAGSSAKIRDLLEFATDAIASSGEIELFVRPEFEIVGLGQTTPRNRPLPVPARGRDGTRLVLDLGAMQPGERRPEFILEVRAPSTGQDMAATAFMQARGCIRVGADRIDLNGKEVAEKRIAIDRNATYFNPAFANALAGIRLQMDVERHIARSSGNSTTCQRIYSEAATKARDLGNHPLAESFADTATKLREGLTPGDAQNSQRIASSKTTKTRVAGSGQRSTEAIVDESF